MNFQGLVTLFLITLVWPLQAQENKNWMHDCARDKMIIEKLRSKLVNPNDLQILSLVWTDELLKPHLYAARDRHLFAIANRFGGAHDMMNHLDQTVEVEYYFRKNTGTKRRGFAMGFISEMCIAEITYMGVKPFQL